MVSGVVLIFYFIYFIYIFSLFIDWELIINSEHAVWGILFIMLALIFVTCSIISLHIGGYHATSLSGGYMAIILCTLLLVFGIILFYQYNTTNKTKPNIMSKITRKGFIPLNYQYGIDAQEIAMRLGIATMENLTLQEMWLQLMSRGTKPEDIKRLISGILGCDLNDSIDVHYNLLWYLCISDNPHRINLNIREIKYVIKSNIEELNELLGENYMGAKDRASLIFTLLSGQIIPDVQHAHIDRMDGHGNALSELNLENLRKRYEELKLYHPSVVYNLAFIQNKIIDHDNGTYSFYGPYTYLSMQPQSLIETIITNIGDEDYNDLIQRLGIGPITNFDNMSNDDIITYLQGELSLYQNVFSREDGFQTPPPIINLAKSDIMNIMSHYTNVELITAYEPRGKWNSRADLLRLICSDVLDGPRWSIHSVLNCNNDDTMNVITMESHGDVNKSDIEDPTLSYGIHKNYRCFQVSELEAAFDDYDGIFLFRVPDWNFESIDSITRAALPREFPLDSIKQLKILLEHERHNYNVESLINKIQTGIDFMKSTAIQTYYLKHQFEGFSFEQKQTAELYLAWMFTYSMWMRFWKGPGNPWPLTKVNVTHESVRNRAQRSSPQERDEHIFIQDGVRTAIIEMYERDTALKQWIEALPTIYYDFETQESSCATHNIKSILDEIALGNYCMGFGSDTILKTSYYYITTLLEYPEGKQFDEFIENMFPRIQDLEYTVVTNQLNTVHSGSRYDILNSRLNILNQPIPKQQSFNTNTYQNNIHVE